MALRHRASRAATWIRCRFGHHELITVQVPADPDTDRPAAIRLRCLHCPHVTPGWEQGRPAYRRTYDGGPTAKEREAAERAAAVEVAASGGGPNVAKFGLARKRRSR